MTHMSPFFAALQDLMLANEPHPRTSEPAPATAPRPCAKCGGSGETGSGRECNWCSDGVPDEPEGDDDMTVEQMCLNMGVK